MCSSGLYVTLWLYNLLYSYIASIMGKIFHRHKHTKRSIFHLEKNIQKLKEQKKSINLYNMVKDVKQQWI